MATILTFGKYKGWSMEDLAQAGKYGRNYLHWCATNLQNPAQRSAADRALKIFTQPKEELIYRMIAAEPDYREWDAEEIECEVENEIAQAGEDAIYAERLAAREDQLRADLVAMGCTSEVVNFVMLNQYDADIVFARIKFSSVEKQAAFTAAWNRSEQAIPYPIGD